MDYRKVAPILGICVLVQATCVYSIARRTHTTTPHTATAEQIANSFKRSGFPIGDITTYTTITDTNYLLGRPGAYTSKASFTDTRVLGDDTQPGSVDAGGSIEVYSNHTEAQARADYIANLEKAMPLLGTEYDYIHGTTLLRLSPLLDPEQATAYSNATH